MDSGPLLSVTTAPLNLLTGGSYVDLNSTLDMMRLLTETCAVDGFELQDLAEWDARGPPLDVRTKKHRISVWEQCEKYDLDEIIRLTRDASILSVHANRDIGICLCSDDEAMVLHGRELIEESLRVAEAIGAGQAVFHLWDTWSTNFDPSFLREELHKISLRYPTVISSVENVPTHLEGMTPFDLAKMFDWITLDTRWAGVYDELDAYLEIRERITNVHLRGSLEGNEWQLLQAPYTFKEALETIIATFGYSKLFTVEPERSENSPTWNGMREAMDSLKRRIRYLSS